MVLAASARCGGLFEGLLALKGRSPRLGRDGGLFVPGMGGGPRQTRTGAHYRAVPPNCHCLKVQEAGHNHRGSTRSPTSTWLGADRCEQRLPLLKNKARSRGPGRSLVAGTGFEPVTFGL